MKSHLFSGVLNVNVGGAIKSGVLYYIWINIDFQY